MTTRINNNRSSSPSLNNLSHHNSHHLKKPSSILSSSSSSSPSLLPKNNNDNNNNNNNDGANKINNNNNNNNEENSGSGSGSSHSGNIPIVILKKTPLVKNGIELDFSGKASKEGIFSLWSNALEKKKLNYTSKEMSILIEPPDSSTFLINSPLLNSSANGSKIKSSTATTRQSQQPLAQQEENSTLFELTHHCIFFPINSNSLIIKKDIVTTMNYYFCQIIKESSTSIKIIIKTLFEVFGFYLDLARKLEEDENNDLSSNSNTNNANSSNSNKTMIYLINSLDKLIQDSLFTKFRDPTNEFQLSSIQRLFINILTDQLKSIKNQSMTSMIFNDCIQKFNFILSIVIEKVEQYKNSEIIKQSLRLDKYLEKTLFLKCKHLSSREYFLAQLKFRKFSIDYNQYYKSLTNFQQWKKQEELTIQKLSQQTLQRDEYLKTVWGINSSGGSSSSKNNKNFDNSPIGVIVIKVVSARDLIQKESQSIKPESFVEVEFISNSSKDFNKKKRTKKINSLNPIWKEHFSFQITKQQLNDEIELTIWDSSTSSSTSSSSSSSSSLSTDKFNFQGKCKFIVKDLMIYLKREVNWYPLQKRTSRSKVSGDLKLQFNYLPYPEASPDKVINYVYYLQILLDKLIEIDSNSNFNPINLNNDDLNNNGSSNSSGSSSGGNISPILKKQQQQQQQPIILSNQSNLLLKEFCERYGIMEHTLKLFYMKRLVVSTIKYLSLEYIPEIRLILKNTLEIKFGEIGLTQEEDEILKESVSALSQACKSWISHYHSVFPLNQPAGSLRMLIDIYYLLKNSELSILPPLQDLIKETYLNRYKQAIIMSNDIGKLNSSIIVPSVKLNQQQQQQQQQQKQEDIIDTKASKLIRICDILLYNLEIDKKYFSREFPNDSPILLISIEVYTNEISKEIDELLEKGSNSSNELQDFFQLYLKLKETMTKFKEIYPKLVLLPIPILFKQVIMQWTLFCADQLKQVIDRLCTNEKWTPVSSDTLHSASVGEVILGCYHALDVIKSLRWEDLIRDDYHKNSHHSLFEIFANFTMVVSESVIYYTKVIKDLSLSALDQAADDIFKLSESYSQGLEQTIQKVSLRFNNIQACIGHAEDLIQVLIRIMSSYKLSTTIVNEMATNTYKAISANVRTLVDRIYDRLSPVIQGEIYKIIGIELDDGKNKNNIVLDFFQKIEKGFEDVKTKTSSAVGAAVGNSELYYLNQDKLPITVRLEPLLNYIASKLKLFSQYLYYPLTKLLLKRCFYGIMHEIEVIVFPSNKKLVLTMNQLDKIEALIKTFSEFFLVDGEGLSQKAIDKQSQGFMIIVLAYREALNSGVHDFDPLGLKMALRNINFTNLKPDLTYLKKLNINLKEIPKQLDVFSLIKKSVEKRQEDKKKRDELRKQRKLNKSIGYLNENQQSQKFDPPPN
ncbi:hypothetical protein DDB_G0268686 [Dictyostelium discoideum AX4]|uniref:C2 domain-containing protein n=1 Tax=Dictyostelium discoideum TaxID=44689 RepID=Q55F06_DICDI|nr:hypothetical protein DDB_G0268686 [Dictyostelium discoideum AX4]EAL72932.1 hypothetical protein DDB_G0268686 [Dictyostelium discoideum AX4]|eukprot:XP_646864.1 hypothetical protein DDB_G0268686 [Dictyostelium discoideum AX4]